jgi:uncharacterized protein (UPF0210 family)
VHLFIFGAFAAARFKVAPKNFMTKSELEQKLKSLKDELEDLEDAIAFNLMNTAAHIPGGHVRKDEELLEELKKKIAGIERELNLLPGGS